MELRRIPLPTVYDNIRGQMEIYVMTLTGNKLTIMAHSEDTIEEIK
jgi:hypothetical protein